MHKTAWLALVGSLAALPSTAQVAKPEGKAPTTGKVTAIAPADEFDKATLQGLSWRSIGPYRGGRSVAAVGVETQPMTYYFGGTGGGVFKTTNGGVEWKPVTDGQIGTGSVGAIAVAESDPNVVYVGMGEACLRGNLSRGDGVYKSTDAGKTWSHVGLRDTQHIGAVLVHPTNPELVYVAALGHAFGPNKERGVFRSRDGGKTWDKVHFVDENTGAIDLAMDPTNPRVLFAGMYQVRRSPWGFDSGGPGSGLYHSTDGGDTWKKLEGEGLPKGVWGKLGVSVSGANSSRVYAIIEAEEGGVFRSNDGGKTWSKVNDERKLRQRAWYYTHIYADPKNQDVVYVLNVEFSRSQDGGKTWSTVRTPHGDNHDLWIAKNDANRMIAADDGGAHVSLDGGATWTRQDNQATAQFYHVIADDRFPYYVYGAQQDNSTVAIASRTSGVGIDATEWYPVGGCESGYIAPKPGDPNVVYAGCYEGMITRYDHRTKQERDVTVYPDNPMGWGVEGMKYRFQWTAPIVASPHDPETVYAAGNVLFRSRNGGQSWEAISPDLTRNDASKFGPSGGPITKDNTSVEYYGTIFAFAESRLEKGLFWAGSDDGLVHVSRDAGKTWSNVTPKDLPEWSMVSQIDPSPHEAGTMYLAVNRYKLDDNRPFIYVTTDYGKTWRKITSGIPDGAFVRAVRQDTVRRDLLFAGTETGIYASFDSGAKWQPIQLNLPVVPITDLVVKDNDLVVATQGRSFWILDDIAPLRQLAKTTVADDAFLFKPSPAYRFFGLAFPLPNRGQNPPNGALLYYSLKNAVKEGEEITLEILDGAGKSVRKFSSKADPDKKPSGGFLAELFGATGPTDQLPAKAGLNRFAWDLRYPEASSFDGMILWGGGTDGPVAVPGAYQAKLTVAGKSYTEPFEVRKNPRVDVTVADLQKQFDLQMKIRDKLTETHDAIKRIRSVRDQLTSAADRAKGTPGEKAVADAAEALKKKLLPVEEALYQTKNKSSQDPLNFPIRLNNKLASLQGVIGSADAAPTEQSVAVYQDLVARIDKELATLKTTLDEDVPAFVKLVKEQEVPAIVIRDEKK
jgi:photosystem II stability/assembly factor-like uncharacterized protein